MVSLDHINLSVENLSDSLNWYKNLFKFEVVEKGQHRETPYAIIQNDQSLLCLYELPSKAKPDTSDHHKVYHFGLRVSDPELWEKHLQSLNIEPHLVWDYPHSKSWYLYDPTGHEIEVCYWHNNKIQFQPLASETQ